MQGPKDLVQSVGMTHVSPTSSACVEQEMERTPSLILQLATFESSFKEQQRQDPVLKEVISWKPHSSTGFTSFFLTHGREARLPTNLLLPNCVLHSPSNSPAHYAADLICKLQDVFTAAAQNREYAYHQQKRHYDKNLKFSP